MPGKIRCKTENFCLRIRELSIKVCSFVEEGSLAGLYYSVSNCSVLAKNAG
jgi:hypothetical protein